MAQPFILDAQLRLTGEVLGLSQIKQQIAGINAQTAQTAQANIANVAPAVSANTQAILAQAQAMSGSIAAGQALNVTLKDGSAALKISQASSQAASKAAKDFGDSVAIAGRRYAAFIAATTVAFKGLDLIKNATSAIIEFESAMIKLDQIIRPTSEQLQEMQNGFLDLAVATGTSADEIGRLAKFLAQAGFRDFGPAAESGKRLTDTLSELAKVPLLPAFDSAQQAADGMVAILNQFGGQGLTAIDVLNKLNSTANNFAITSGDIIEATKRGGAAMATLGVSFDDFLGLITAVREQTRESAATIGTAFKTIGPRIVSPRILDFLRDQQVETRNAAGEFIGFIPLMENIKKKFDELTDVEGVQFAEKLGGLRQITRLLALLNNFDRVGEIADNSRQSFNSVNEDVEKGLKAIGVQLNILKETARRFAIELGPDVFIPVIKNLIDLGHAAINIGNQFKSIIPFISQFVQLLTIIGATRVGTSLIGRIAGALGGRVAAGAAVPSIAGFGGAADIGVGAADARVGAAGILKTSVAQQALLLLSASAISTSDSLDKFSRDIITNSALITSAFALLRKQTISSFFGSGGLLPSLGKAVGGVGTGALIIGIAGAKSIQNLSDDIIERASEGARKALSGVKFDPTKTKVDVANISTDFVRRQIDLLERDMDRILRPQPGQKVTTSFGKNIAETSFRIRELIGGIINADTDRLSNAISLDLTDRRIRDEVVRNIERVKDQIVGNLTLGILDIENSLSDFVVDIPFAPDIRNFDTGVIIQQITGRAGEKITSALIEIFGGSEELANEVKRLAGNIKKENEIIQVAQRQAETFVPVGLTGQLLRFSRAIEESTIAIDRSIANFEGLLPAATPLGVSRGPQGFDQRTVTRGIVTGSLDQIFKDIPSVQDFVTSLESIDNTIDKFIVSTSSNAQKLDSLNLTDLLDDFISTEDLKPDISEFLRFTFEDIVSQINQEAVGGGARFLDPSELKNAIGKRFREMGLQAQPAIVEEVTRFIEISFRQIQANINRLATIRRSELDSVVSEGARLESLIRSIDIAGALGAFGNDLLIAAGNIEQIPRQFDVRAMRARLDIPSGIRPGDTAADFRLQDIATRTQLIRGGVTDRALQTTAIVEDQRLRRALIQDFVRLQEEVARASVNLSNLSGRDLIDAGQEFEQLQTRLIQTGAALTDLQRNVETGRRVRLQELDLRRSRELQQFDIETDLRRAGRPPASEQQFLEMRQEDRARLELQFLEDQIKINDDFDKILDEFSKTQVDSIKIFDAATRLQVDASETSSRASQIHLEAAGSYIEAAIMQLEAANTMRDNMQLFQNNLNILTRSTVDQSSLGSPSDIATSFNTLFLKDAITGAITEISGENLSAVDLISRLLEQEIGVRVRGDDVGSRQNPIEILQSNANNIDKNSSAVISLKDAVEELSNTIENNQIVGPQQSIDVQAISDSISSIIRDISNRQPTNGGVEIDTGDLSQKLQDVVVALGEPGQIRLDTQNRFDINIQGLDREIEDKIVPLLRQASEEGARAILARAFRSLASLSDTEMQIALNQVANRIDNI